MGATPTSPVSNRGEDDTVVALLAVPPQVRRVEISSAPEDGRVGAGALCTLDAGLALCVLRAEGDTTVVVFDAEEGGRQRHVTAGPLTGSGAPGAGGLLPTAG